MDFLKDSKGALDKVVKIINSGGVVVFPTDTVYGFLADAGNKEAVEYIYKIKKRPRSKPLAVFVKDFKMAKQLAKIDERQEKILKKYWPGRYTFILRSIVIPAKAGIQSKSTNSGFRVKPGMTGLIIKNKTIAIRIPDYKLLNELLKKINKPLAQTSVNISGEPPLVKIKDIIGLIENRVKPDLTRNLMIIDAGNLPKRKPSKIIDLTAKKLRKIR